MKLTTKQQDQHFTKYENLFKLKGMQFLPFSKKEIEAALNSGDENLNTLPLRKWDMAAHRVGWTNKKDGKSYKTLAEQVCLLKHIAKYHIAFK